MPSELYKNGFIYITDERPTWKASHPVSPRKVIPLQTGGQKRFFSKRFRSEQRAEAQLQRVANQ
jgi:hypothetical protein